MVANWIQSKLYSISSVLASKRASQTSELHNMKNGDDINSMLACLHLAAELRLDSDSCRRRGVVLGGTVRARHQEHPIILNHKQSIKKKSVKTS